MPRLELEANLFENAHTLESESFVKGDAPRVRQRDAREGFGEALDLKNSEKGRVQGARDTSALLLLIHVHRDLSGPSVGRS